MLWMIKWFALTKCTVSFQPNEDVTYASINHETMQGQRRIIANTDCDYATVGLPQNLVPETVSNCSSKEECTDDYVLME